MRAKTSVYSNSIECFHFITSKYVFEAKKVERFLLFLALLQKLLVKISADVQKMLISDQTCNFLQEIMADLKSSQNFREIEVCESH